MGTTVVSPNGHIGHNLKCIRSIKGMKQEVLAMELGEDWNQKKISHLEDQASIDSDLLAQVAKILDVSPEMIQNFDEKRMNTFFNTFNDSSVGNISSNLYSCNFSPIDKIVELYERLLTLTGEREKAKSMNKGE